MTSITSAEAARRIQRGRADLVRDVLDAIEATDIWANLTDDAQDELAATVKALINRYADTMTGMVAHIGSDMVVSPEALRMLQDVHQTIVAGRVPAGAGDD